MRLGLGTEVMGGGRGGSLGRGARGFLQLYPTARILVADETNFAKEKRARFLARAATACWDAIIITHSAFRFIAVPAAFERRMIEDQIAMHEAAKLRADGEDRTTRKRIQAMTAELSERLEPSEHPRADTVTIAALA